MLDWIKLFLDPKSISEEIKPNEEDLDVMRKLPEPPPSHLISESGKERKRRD